MTNNEEARKEKRRHRRSRRALPVVSKEREREMIRSKYGGRRRICPWRRWRLEQVGTGGACFLHRRCGRPALDSAAAAAALGQSSAARVDFQRRISNLVAAAVVNLDSATARPTLVVVWFFFSLTSYWQGWCWWGGGGVMSPAECPLFSGRR